MNITVKRFEFGSTYTIGKMYIDGEYFCFTLEDKARQVDGQEVSKWKIPGQTAIPTGTYSVTVDMSNRFKRLMPHIMNVPGFDGIRIHSGNTDADTEGCILLGQHWNGAGMILNSRIAFDLFFDKLQKAGSATISIE